MEKESILNQIMTKNQLQNLVNLNIVAIADQLFNNLNAREKDVLTRRFGLHGQKRETLESIGGQHGLTRERIRQIESGSINKVRKYPELEQAIGQLRQSIAQLLAGHGGMMSQDHLFTTLQQLSKAGVEPQVFNNYLHFLTSKVLQDEIVKVSNANYFNRLFKLRHQSLDHLEAVAKELLTVIQNKKQLLSTSELIDTVKTLSTYQSNQNKFVSNQIDLGDLVPVEGVVVTDRAIYAFLQALTDVEQNKFGFWGHKAWREVNPKTINDKIYLVLKYNGQPMYYGDIAQKISELGFDHKKVNTATTHNELILDDKYILVGRGLYGLKEWGYKQGTVADVIADILADASQTLNKQEITDRVLKQRLVKQTTINLALMNKDRFNKTGEGKYQLKQN